MTEDKDNKLKLEEASINFSSNYTQFNAPIVSPRGIEALGASLLFLNIIISFLRVQDLPGMSWVGVIKFPAIISVIVGLLWLTQAGKNHTRESKMLIFFFFMECVRLLVGKFLDPSDTIVRNDFWQFQTIKDLFMQFSGLVFPIIVFLPYRRCLGKFVFYSALIGGFLGLWSITHGGRGPGGFIGDENDLCLTLLYFMGITLATKVVVRNNFGKVFCLGLFILIFAGVIATQSRGGFLGLIALCVTALFQSRYKMRVLTGLLVFILIAMPFIPGEYINEVKSIKSDYYAKESTITERLETWGLTSKVWLDPPHILTGVGLQNTPWWFPNYEPPERVHRARSLAGRATHSLYFQLLGDLGVWGVIVFLTVIGGAYRGNIKIRKEISSLYNNLTSNYDNQGKLKENAKQILSELSYLDYIIYATNCAWIAVLVAGIGISVLYYPTIWTLVGFSLAIRWYWRKLLSLIANEVEAASR